MEWFYSYLSNRTKVVNINLTISDLENLTYGIPRCLRPVTFPMLY